MTKRTPPNECLGFNLYKPRGLAAGRAFREFGRPGGISAPLTLQLQIRYLTGEKVRARIFARGEILSRTFPRGENILC